MLAFHSPFHKADKLRYYNLSFRKIAEDDGEDLNMVAQILNEALAIVARSNMAISYSVYMVLCYGDEDELIAHKVYSPIKCVDPESTSSELHAHLETVLKERSLYSTFGWGNLSEISREEFDELSKNNRHCQA
jgi:hypothetical protein